MKARLNAAAMSGTGNMFQAFRCRTVKQGSRSETSLHGSASEHCKRDGSTMADTVGLGDFVKHESSSAVPDRDSLGRPAAQCSEISARSASRKRQKMAPELRQRDIPAVVKAESIDQAVDIDRLAAIAAADETVYKEDVERPAAAAVLSEISRRARGREGINLDDAKGLPERLGDRPLRLIIGGNNPSDHAWKTGHYYSHKSNRMWKVLPEAGIVPPWADHAECDERVLHEVAVGFTDVGTGHPGTILSQVESKAFEEWAPGFYERLSSHMKRASDSMGCACGQCGAPAYVAWSGKRQWMELLNVGRRGKDRYKKLEHGLQHMRPKDWPLPARTKVWVCSSTSGAAPMTTAERLGPWQQLSKALKAIEWPPAVECRK